MTATTLIYGPPTRRDFVKAIGSVMPLAFLAGSTAARLASDDCVFLRVSRLITGVDGLSGDISARIEGLLLAKVPGFAAKLDNLGLSLRGTLDARDVMLAALTDTQVETALEIARPWYLGYVGDPADTILHDDAVFATYLEAQSFDKILDVVPRPTYPGNNAGWWVVPPPGVDAPSMPATIADWTFHPGGPSAIAAPDPAWRSYAVADHASIADARSAKP